MGVQHAGVHIISNKLPLASLYIICFERNNFWFCVLYFCNCVRENICPSCFILHPGGYAIDFILSVNMLFCNCCLNRCAVRNNCICVCLAIPPVPGYFVRSVGVVARQVRWISVCKLECECGWRALKLIL